MIRIILSLLLFSGMAAISQGQSLLLSTGSGNLAPNGVIGVDGDLSGNPAVAHIYITNTGSSPITVKVKKIENYLVDGASASMCWAGNCYPPDVYVTPLGLTLAPGETNTDSFSGDLFPGTNGGISSVSFVFFDENNTADSVMAVVNYLIRSGVQNLSLSWAEGTIPDNGTISLPGHPSDEKIDAFVFATNNSAAPIDVKVRKIETFLIPNSVNVFCWGLCYDPSTYVSTVSVTIGAGATNNNGFHGEYYPNLMAGISGITYVFFNEADPSDFVAVNVNYEAVMTSSITDLNGTGGKLTVSAYPNPAVSQVKFSYDLGDVHSARIVVYSLLGNIVKEFTVNEETGEVIWDVSGLDEGLYFYSLLWGNETLKTQKLVINR
ncbi:MAG: T9SS type A sorting domain-containing protein [Bacteroidales bacterium]|nr:T9SS type A sorting domain-containing protein [Bacteroidales bacterium]